MRKYKVAKEELETIVKLYMARNPFCTPARVYARWKCGKLKLLGDYKIWQKNEFLAIFEQKKDENEQKNHISQRKAQNWRLNPPRLQSAAIERQAGH